MTTEKAKPQTDQTTRLDAPWRFVLVEMLDEGERGELERRQYGGDPTCLRTLAHKGKIGLRELWEQWRDEAGADEAWARLRTLPPGWKTVNEADEWLGEHIQSARRFYAQRGTWGADESW